MMNFLNDIKRRPLSDEDKNIVSKSSFWRIISNAFKKDTGGVGDPDDPEFDAQKIYTHYLNNLSMYDTWVKIFG